MMRIIAKGFIKGTVMPFQCSPRINITRCTDGLGNRLERYVLGEQPILAISEMIHD
jgi:hypothetical protein